MIKQLFKIFIVLVAVWVTFLRLFEVIMNLGISSASRYQYKNLIIEVIPDMLSVIFCGMATYFIFIKLYRK